MVKIKTIAPLLEKLNEAFRYADNPENPAHTEVELELFELEILINLIYDMEVS